MIIMPSNNTGTVVQKLIEKYPDKLALLLNHHCIRPHHFKFKYAIDNAAFRNFNENLFYKLLDTSTQYQKPMFVVCPDVVGCHDRTLALWKHYYPSLLMRYNYPIAFVAQDGCKPELIPDAADWIFIGGNDPWKMDNIHKFIGTRPVHVGRVNGIGRLKYCESIGVASVDGTGWMLARDKKFYDLMQYFEREKQCSLF